MEGASLSTFNAATHIRTGAESTETSTTTVDEQGTMQQETTNQNETASTEQTATTTESNTQVETQTAQENTSEEKFNESVFSFGEQESTAPATENATQQAQAQVFNWKEEIGKIDQTELYNHLGIDPFALQLNAHLKKGGKAADYISMQGINYDEVSDEDLIRQDLKDKHPNLSRTEIDRLYARRYGVNEDTDEGERADRELDLKSAAYQVRVQKKAEQANYKMPEPITVSDEKYEAWKEETRQQETLKQKISTYYNEHPTTKTLNETKRVVISLGDGVEPFNIVLDKPEVLTKMVAESSLYKAPVLTKTGEPDVYRQQLVTLFEANPQKFITDIFNYGKSFASRAKVAEGQNAQRQPVPVSNMPSGETSYGTGRYNQSVNTK